MSCFMILNAVCCTAWCKITLNISVSVVMAILQRRTFALAGLRQHSALFQFSLISCNCIIWQSGSYVIPMFLNLWVAKQFPEYFTQVSKYKVVQIWPGRFACKQVTVCPGHIWTTLYIISNKFVHILGSYAAYDGLESTFRDYLSDPS